MKLGFMPSAFQLELIGVLNAPSGVLIKRGKSLLPTTALIWSVGLTILI